MQFAGLWLIGWDFWIFIPKGDMPRWTCVMLEVRDRVGRMCRLGACPGASFLPPPEMSDDAFDLAPVHIRMADERSAVRQKKMLRGGVECSTR